MQMTETHRDTLQTLPDGLRDVGHHGVGQVAFDADKLLLPWAGWQQNTRTEWQTR